MDDSTSVTPPFRKGTRDDFWVKTRRKNHADIRDAARQKALKCYGIKIKCIDIAESLTTK
jgi:hypothetical protein